MEEEKIGEQPSQTVDNVQEGIVDSGTTSDTETDGSLGKFKDAQSLLSAYNSLQAEFTKKCQKLSEVSKMLDEAQQNQTMEKDETPIYNKENWKENVSSFLNENSKAKEYSGEIANEILQDKNLQLSPNALELAWARVMARKFESPKNLAADQKFIDEQILSRPEIQKQVLDEYFTKLQNTKNPPVIVSHGSVAMPTIKEPTTMSEAKVMVEKLFNLKG